MKKNSGKWDLAVGLSYHNLMSAPILGVKGSGALAQQIIRAARRYGVPVIENQALATALAAADLDSSIPPELYEAVAIVLNRLEQKNGGTR